MSDDEMEMIPKPPEPRSVRADMAERAERAWQARVLGATWREAAQVAGYSDASNAVRAVRGVYGELPKVERDDLRHLWRTRLEKVWRQAYADVLERRSGAVTAAVRVAGAAAALDGLDEPTRVALSNPTADEIERWVAEVLALRGTQHPVEADIFGVIDAEVVENDPP